MLAVGSGRAEKRRGIHVEIPARRPRQVLSERLRRARERRRLADHSRPSAPANRRSRGMPSAKPFA